MPYLVKLTNERSGTSSRSLRPHPKNVLGKVTLLPESRKYTSKDSDRDRFLSDIERFKEQEQKYNNLLLYAFGDMLDQFRLGYGAMIVMYSAIFIIDLIFVASAAFLFYNGKINSVETYASLLGAMLSTGLLLMVNPVEKLQNSRTSQAKMIVILYNWFYNRYNWVEHHKDIQCGHSSDREFFEKMSRNLCEHTSDTLSQLNGCMVNNSESLLPRYLQQYWKLTEHKGHQ